MVDAGHTNVVRPRTVLVTTAVVLALGLSGCGGEGVTLPSVTRSSGSVVLPSVTISLPSRSPSVAPTAEETPEPTQEPATETPEATTEAPTPTPTPTRTAQPPTTTVTATPTPEPTQTVTETSEPTPTETVTETPTPTPTPSPSPTSTEVAAGETTADESAVAPWVWWLGLAALLAAGLAAYLVPRSRRRKEWAADLAADEAEVAWFAHELLPRLQLAASPDALAGGWQVASARVTATEDRLTGLESTARDDAGRARARALRDAVRAARTGVEELVVAGLPGPRTAELSLLSNQLDAVLAPPPPTAPPASGSV